jgi:phosphoadenosine phosphosulfate reductase
MIEYHNNHQACIFVNPMIDWGDDDVWEFIKEYKIKYPALYDNGYTRLGCIGCPMNTKAKEDIDKYPGFKRLYLRAFAKMIIARKAKGLPVNDNWTTPEAVMDWWLGTAQNINDKTDLECDFFGFSER